MPTGMRVQEMFHTAFIRYAAIQISPQIYIINCNQSVD